MHRMLSRVVPLPAPLIKHSFSHRFYSEALANQTNTSTLQNNIEASIKSGHNVCIAGNPFNYTHFTNLVSSLLEANESRPRSVLMVKEYFRNIDVVYKELEELKTRNSREEAFVVSPTMEVAAQNYSMCRRLDKDNLLRMSRMGSSLEIYCPLSLVFFFISQ
eukprot:TRINITY_DN9645_c0_g1_i4.p1 TRINITY_DN9645_c0_g1~~TRINITY_DN9645_c0_g1_i4.p1  ORF type:complete len:162 (-),score=22.78 TRINITY_DN9645_c0_g1_i4:840-1325(-)